MHFSDFMDEVSNYSTKLCAISNQSNFFYYWSNYGNGDLNVHYLLKKTRRTITMNEAIIDKLTKVRKQILRFFFVTKNIFEGKHKKTETLTLKETLNSKCAPTNKFK